MKTKTIAHFANGIGNLVLYTPVLQALASMDESKKVDMCLDSDWGDSRLDSIIDFIKHLPFVDEIKTYPDNFSGDYKVWFWTDWSTHKASKDLFHKKWPYEPQNWNKMEVHESDYYFNILKKYYKYEGEKPKQFVGIDQSGPIIDKGKYRIGLCNGAFGYLRALKSWTFFPSLAHELKMFYKDDIAIIKIGCNEELKDVEEYDLDFVNKLTISQCAKVIKQLDLLITTDTGNMHIADALGIPMIVLWGGTIVEKNKPINSPHKILRMGLNCQPCQDTGDYRDCISMECMNNITVGEVMYTVRQYLKERNFYDVK
jgi:hypothetical protein